MGLRPKLLNGLGEGFRLVVADQQLPAALELEPNGPIAALAQDAIAGGQRHDAPAAVLGRVDCTALADRISAMGIDSV